MKKLLKCVLGFRSPVILVPCLPVSMPKMTFMPGCIGKLNAELGDDSG